MKHYGSIEDNLENREEISHFQPQSNILRWAFVIAFLIFSVFLLISNSSNFDSLSSPYLSLHSSSKVTYWSVYRSGYNIIDFVAEDRPTLSYELLSNYDAIVEPHAEMELYVDGYDTSSKYSYSIDACIGTECSTGELKIKSNKVKSISFLTSCKVFDTVTLTLSTYKNEKLKSTSTKTAICMSIRREIRSLTSSDLSKAMDAMYTIYSTSEEEGQDAYGSKFHNSTYFSSAHHFHSSWRDADHFHEGLGFLTQHIKLSNMFEQAMQAVDPSVSLPYWDYTIDQVTNPYISNAFPFSEEVFGSITLPSDLTWGWTYRNDSIEHAAIPDGRWKKLKAESFNRYPELSSSYGYMRAPWNTNPSPYISRFSAFTTELPECINHYRMLEYSTLVDFLVASPYAPHASVHGAIGSVFGCDAMDDLRELGLILDTEHQILLCQKWSFILKELYRKNFISFRTDCSYQTNKHDSSDKSTETATIDCGIICNEHKIKSLPKQLSMVISSKYVGTLTDDDWETWGDFICEGEGHQIFVGDHVESASPADPSFWPMHPTLERLLHAKLLSGGFSSTAWPSDSQTDYVCDKAQCLQDEGNDTYAYNEDCCYGHYENDQLFDFVSGDRSKYFGPSNAHILSTGDPTSTEYSLHYMYDSFSWDHCFLDFDALLSSRVNNEHGNQLIWT